MRGRALVLATLVVATASEAHEANPSRYNYRDHVRPIFVTHCGDCHRPGGVAPMSLLEFQEAVPWANAVKLQLLEQTMPPWLPADGIGVFRHARSLTAEEVDIVIDWAVGQTPEGEPFTTPELETAPRGASPSELLLTPEADVVLTEDEFEKTACVVMPTKLARSRVATRFAVEPGQPTLLRRATVFLGKSCEEGRPLATWLPDQDGVSFPDGSGVTIGPGDSLSMELLYVKGWEDDGKRLSDRTRLGVSFAAGARPIEPVRIAGSDYAVARASSLVALYPDPSESEEPLRVEAVLPDGRTETVLVIERFDPVWREKYVLEHPLALPAGSRLRVSRPTVWVDLLRSPRAAGVAGAPRH